MNLKHLLFLAVAGTMAIACNEVDEASSINSQKTLGTISSGSDRFATRVNLDSEWEDGDAIGVYMFDTNNKNILNHAINVKYEADASGINTAFTASPGIAIYDEPANFIAYYPHSADANNIDVAAALYKVDISNQSAGLSTHDLMWAKATDKATDDLLTNGLSLTFRHQLALLRVNIKNENVTNVESVTVGGMNTTATFNLIDGALTNIATTKAMTLYKAGAKSFVGVMLPTTELKKKMSLTVVANGKKFQYSVPESSTVTEFEAGYEYSFNITLTKTDGSELDGNEGSNEPWQPGGNEDGTGGEVSDNKDIPADYTQVPVGADTDLANVLSGTTGKIALVFADGEYAFSDKITVPADVTELLFISETANQVKINLTAGVTWGGTTLSKLAFNNLEITGAGVKLVEMNCVFAADGAFEIKKCYIHDIKDILAIDNTPATTLSSFTVEDCRIVKIASLFYRYGAQKVTIANSTLYDMEYTANSGAMGTIDVQNSTLVGLRKTQFENSGKLIFKNNILACFAAAGSDNLTYKTGEILEFSDNYAAASTEANLLPMIKIHKNNVDGSKFPNAWTDLTKTMAELFEDASGGNFKTTITNAGDPRWRPATN